MKQANIAVSFDLGSKETIEDLDALADLVGLVVDLALADTGLAMLTIDSVSTLRDTVPLVVETLRKDYYVNETNRRSKVTVGLIK